MKYLHFIFVFILCLGNLSAQTRTDVLFRWGSTDVHYSIDEVPTQLNKSAFPFPVWKGERVCAQAVLWTKKDLSEVNIVVSDLIGNQSYIPAEAVRAQFLGYVLGDNLDESRPNQCGPRNKIEWDSLSVADVLDIVSQKNVKANTAQPIWITIAVPADTKAGKYKGSLTVSGGNLPSTSLTIDLEVLNRTLPQPKDWKFHLDLWQNPYAVARYHQVPLWSDAHFEAMRPVMKLLADAGQKVITTTLLDRPWNGQTQDAFGSMVTKMKRVDGSWMYDYTIFDKWVEFMHSVGIDRQINCYSLIPWALEFDYFDQASNQILYIKEGTDNDAYQTCWKNFIVDFARHLRKKGWFEKTMIAMDERPLDAMQKALLLIKSVEPAFKVSLAGNYHPEIESELSDFCIAFGQEFPADVKAKRARNGMISTVYTCCAEYRPNTFIASPLAEATWIGWHALAKNYDGYLRWAYNSWTLDPINDARFRNFAAGDCFIVYPGGRSSTRMEKLIEGIQDYEKACILREEWTQSGNKRQLKRLELVLENFNLKALTKDGAEIHLKKAKAIIN